MYLLYHLGWLVYDLHRLASTPSPWTLLMFALGVMWVLRGVGRLVHGRRW